jgi:hypothetical protein
MKIPSYKYKFKQMLKKIYQEAKVSITGLSNIFGPYFFEFSEVNVLKNII